MYKRQQLAAVPGYANSDDEDLKKKLGDREYCKCVAGAAKNIGKAIQYDCIACVNRLIASQDAAKLVKDSKTALIQAATEGGTQIVKALIPIYAGLTDNMDRTALSYAVEHGHLDIVKLLEPVEGNVYSQGACFKLNYACSPGRDDIFFWLLEHSKYLIKANGETPLHVATRFTRADFVRKIAARYAGSKNADGQTALDVAFRMKELGTNTADLIEELLEYPAENVHDAFPLAFRIIRARDLNGLIKLPAEIRMTDNGGGSALEYAARVGDHVIIKHVFARSSKRLYVIKALQIAVQNRNPAIIELLIRYWRHTMPSVPVDVKLLPSQDRKEYFSLLRATALSGSSEVQRLVMRFDSMLDIVPQLDREMDNSEKFQEILRLAAPFGLFGRGKKINATWWTAWVAHALIDRHAALLMKYPPVVVLNQDMQGYYPYYEQVKQLLAHQLFPDNPLRQKIACLQKVQMENKSKEGAMMCEDGYAHDMFFGEMLHHNVFNIDIRNASRQFAEQRHVFYEPIHPGAPRLRFKVRLLARNIVPSCRRLCKKIILQFAEMQ